MGFLSKKKEDNSNQDTMPAQAPMAPPDLQAPAPDGAEQPMDNSASSVDELPELPPLDLPDLDMDESDLPQPDLQDEDNQDVSNQDSSEDMSEQDADNSDDNDSSSPMDNLDIPTDLDATEPVEEEGIDSEPVEDEMGSEEPVIDEAPVKEEVSASNNNIQQRVMYDTSSPIFIEQQLYVDSLDDIYHVKGELNQIQKFANLTKDLEDHIGDKFDLYKDTLLSVQKKVLLMEKKLFEE